jgi:anti-sigma factor RsiW
MSSDGARIPDPLDDERLSAYLDGDLDELARARFERDLAADPRLRDALDLLRRTTAFVAREAPAEPPRGFADRVSDAVEALPTPSRAGRWRGAVGWAGVVALAAAALVVVGPTDLSGPDVGELPSSYAQVEVTPVKPSTVFTVTTWALPAARAAELGRAAAAAGATLIGPDGAALAQMPESGLVRLQLPATDVPGLAITLEELGATAQSELEGVTGTVTVTVTLTATPAP